MRKSRLSKMNTHLIATIIVTSVASYLLLTEYRGNHLIQKRIDFNEDGLTVEEKAGYYTVSRATEIFPSRMGGEMKFEIGQNPNGSVFMQFVSPIIWRDQYFDDTLVAVKNFRDAVYRYFEDIAKKLIIKGIIELTTVNLFPFTKGNDTLVQIVFEIQCKIDPKLRLTRILQCQVAAAKLAKQISVNELTFYLNAYAAFEEVVNLSRYTTTNGLCKRVSIFSILNLQKQNELKIFFCKNDFSDQRCSSIRQ